MGEPKTPLSYGMIVAKLQQLCEDKCSGALLILGTIGQSTRIHMTNGEIVALIMQEKKGVEVVPLLPHFKASRMDFIQGLPYSVKIPLPATSLLLAELAAQVPAQPMRPVRAPDSTSVRILDAATQALMVETLAHYIGPMAVVFSQKILAKHQDVEGAIRALAADIPEAADPRRFVAEIRTRLGLPG